MSREVPSRSRVDHFPSSKPKPIKLSDQTMVETAYLEHGELPLVFKPLYKEVSLTEWAAANQAMIRRQLFHHGAILFRFPLISITAFESFAKSISPNLMQYGERSSPRTLVAGNVYTSTDHPPDQPILLHNEQSYTLNWPMMIFFYCLRTAAEGGRTPIADSRRIYKRLSPTVIDRFAQKGVMYVRNYIAGLSLSWQEVFQTEDRAVVETHCDNNGIRFAWKGDQLKTWQVRPAIRSHPHTGEMIWFNHALFFNVAGLEDGTRRNIQEVIPEEDLPYQTYYGDHSPIESWVLEEIRSAYHQETVKFPWQEGDVLLVDNMLVAHGRESFSGERKVVVIMAEPFDGAGTGSVAFMTDAPRRTDFSGFRKVQPKPVRINQDALVRTEFIETGTSFPLVIKPNADDLRLAEWTSRNRDFIGASLLKYGALLFRGFSVKSPADFEAFVKAVSGELMEYVERAAARTEVGNRILTSTEYPADQTILSHHEMSYSHNWPAKIFFYCAQPPQQGGRTPIAEDRKVFPLIDPDVKARFMEKKVMYVRNFGGGADLSWREAFQTNDRTVVEDYCRKFHTEFEWREGDLLRTRQVRQAVAVHPQTGETVWFNHVHLFHVSSLPAAVQEALRSMYRDDEFPRNAFYGDGSSIESSVLDKIRAVYEQCAIAFAWQQNDILALDNFLVSHGREPFVGPRKILVAMSEPYTNLH